MFLMLLLLFVVAAAVTVRGRKSPHSIYNNSRSTAPAAVMLIIHSYISSNGLAGAVMIHAVALCSVNVLLFEKWIYMSGYIT